MTPDLCHSVWLVVNTEGQQYLLDYQLFKPSPLTEILQMSEECTCQGVMESLHWYQRGVPNKVIHECVFKRSPQRRVNYHLPDETKKTCPRLGQTSLYEPQRGCKAEVKLLLHPSVWILLPFNIHITQSQARALRKTKQNKKTARWRLMSEAEKTDEWTIESMWIHGRLKAPRITTTSAGTCLVHADRVRIGVHIHALARTHTQTDTQEGELLPWEPTPSTTVSRRNNSCQSFSPLIFFHLSLLFCHFLLPFLSPCPLSPPCVWQPLLGLAVHDWSTHYPAGTRTSQNLCASHKGFDCLSSWH